MDLYQVINKPLVTEKGTAMLSDGNWVTFKVHMDSNKIQIREAVQKIFSVLLTIFVFFSREKRPLFSF